MSKKGENIYKRKDGRFEARYIKNRKVDGTPEYGYVYARSYNEVKEKLYQKISSLQTHNPQIEETIGSVAAKWLTWAKTYTKESTYARYTVLLNNHIIPALGCYSLSEITSDSVRDFVDAKLTCGRLDGKGGLSAKTVRDILSVLKQVLTYGGMSEVKICMHNRAQISQNSKDILSPNEQTRLTKYLLNDIDSIKLGILLSLYTGMRLGEICALKIKNINLAENCIYVKNTLQRIPNTDFSSLYKTKIVLSEPKTKSSSRAIPLPDFLHSIIKKYTGGDPECFLLSGNSKHFIEPRTLQYKFKRHIAICGIKPIPYHSLRHTFATRCIEVGFDPKTLSEILGHASVNITLNRYVHSSMELKQASMQKLQAVFLPA